MANCYAEAFGDRGSGHRIGSQSVAAKVSTWSGYIKVHLNKDNIGTVELNSVKADVIGIGKWSIDAGRAPRLAEVNPSAEQILTFLREKFKEQAKGCRFPQAEWDSFIAKWNRKEILAKI